jgi:hypothetical protein
MICTLIYANYELLPSRYMKMKNACQRPVIIVANPITREVISYDIKISSVISEISWIVL